MWQEIAKEVFYLCLYQGTDTMIEYKDFYPDIHFCSLNITILIHYFIDLYLH